MDHPDRPRPSPSVPDRLFLDFQSALAGRYSLERELGRGGMGVVYLAHEVRLDRPVAIKLLPPTNAADARMRERFLREARTAAKLSHPNIIPIHAVDEVGEFVFFAMAYVEGETLTERVRRRGPLAPSDATRVLREVAWALAYAHAQGVVHRDVKPDNILLEMGTGRALVMDFGIAGAVRGAGALDDGEVIGTPAFMSPEQALGEAVDARSDLYALGLVGYFALSGRLPFEGSKATEVLARQVTEPAQPLASVAAGVPRRLAQLVERCLAKDPSERPDGAVAMARDLGAALEQRREIPLALRIFVSRHTQVSEGTVVAAVFLLLIIAVLAMTLLGDKVLDVGWAGPFVLTVLGGAILVPAGMTIHHVRALARTGYAPSDLAQAFQAQLEQGREERAFEHGRDASLFERVMRVVSILGLSGALAAWLGLGAGGPWLEWTVFLVTGGLATGLGAGLITVMRLQRRRDIASAWWHRIWGGRAGRWLFRLVTLGLKRDALGPALTHRPTELSLSLAAEQLFEQLPREIRRQLRDLPDVVRRLEDDARRMRGRLEELQDALGGKGEEGRKGEAGASLGIAERRDRVLEDLVAERDLVQQRLRDAVAALETIRLNLLRLHAGSGSVQSLSTDLGLAREVAQEIDRLLEGKREVEAELGRTEGDGGGQRRTGTDGVGA